jgi:hypothetical protein
VPAAEAYRCRKLSEQPEDAAIAESPPSRTLLQWADRLRVDAQGAAVRTEFAAAGIPCIVIKGAGFAQLLYDPGELRPYRDTDLLISPSDRPRAEALLRDLGFADHTFRGSHLAPRPEYADTWQREADGAVIDLHWRLPGTRAPASEVWSTLSHHTVPTTIGSEPAEVLDAPGSAMLCALHVASHGLDVARPLEDLDRALVRLPLATWQGAAALAAEIDATDEFADGLRLSPTGGEVADALDLPRHPSVAARLNTRTSPSGAISVQWAFQHNRWRDRVRFVFLILFPPPTKLRTRSALARKGAAGLAAAYFVNPFWVARRAPAAIRYWRTEARRYR